jgi:hypothetical protein
MGKITCKICGRFEEFAPETRDVTMINAGRHTQKDHPNASVNTVVEHTKTTVTMAPLVDNLTALCPHGDLEMFCSRCKEEQKLGVAYLDGYHDGMKNRA